MMRLAAFVWYREQEKVSIVKGKPIT